MASQTQTYLLIACLVIGVLLLGKRASEEQEQRPICECVCSEGNSQ